MGISGGPSEHGTSKAKGTRQPKKFSGNPEGLNKAPSKGKLAKSKQGSAIISKDKSLLNFSDSKALELCDDIRANYKEDTRDVIKKQRQDSLLNFKIKPYIHSDIDEGDANIKEKYKKKIIEENINSRMMKETDAFLKEPPQWYDRITVYLPKEIEDTEFTCDKPALIHDYIQEVAEEELSIMREMDKLQQITVRSLGA